MSGKSFRMKWHKFRQLSRSEQIWLLKAVVLLPVIYIATRLIGLKRCRALLGRIGGRKKNLSQLEIESLVNSLPRLVAIAANNGLIHVNCLPQSLALWWMLRLRGVESELHFGMRKENEQVKGHAWIERNGKVLNDDADVGDRFLRVGQLQESRS